MAWENRGNKTYYYRKQWIQGSCVSEYVGHGQLAEVIAALEALDRERVELERLAWAEEKAKITGMDRQLDKLCQMIRTITAAALRATGHHQHKGQWRKKRMNDKELAGAEENLKRFNKVLMACNQVNPKPADVKALRQFLKDAPDLARVVNIAEQTVDHLLDEANATVSVKEIMGTRLKLLQEDLGYKKSTPIEQLLIWQVCICWLRLVLFERYYTATANNTTLAKATYYERRLNATQRRFLRVIETLVRVRKLARNTPALQVNIATQGGQQINQIADG